jgi:hypothetical protein
MTWEEAQQFIKGLSLAGHHDWRLLNIKELQSLRWTASHSRRLRHPSSGRHQHGEPARARMAQLQGQNGETPSESSPWG